MASVCTRGPEGCKGVAIGKGVAAVSTPCPYSEMEQGWQERRRAGADSLHSDSWPGRLCGPPPIATMQERSGQTQDVFRT